MRLPRSWICRRSVPSGASATAGIAALDSVGVIAAVSVTVPSGAGGLPESLAGPALLQAATDRSRPMDKATTAPTLTISPPRAGPGSPLGCLARGYALRPELPAPFRHLPPRAGGV